MSILGRLIFGSKPAPGASVAADAERARAAADAKIASGQALEDAGELARAEADYRAALDLAPDYPRAHINLGNALQKQERLEEAAAAHARALEIDPAYAPAHYNLGAVRLALGDAGSARASLERALEINPAMADAAVLLAAACELLGDRARAERELERAIAIDPHSAGALANLGALRLDAGELERARAAFAQALELAPASVPALCGLGRIDLMQGRAREASAAFRRAQQASPAAMDGWSAYLFSLNFRDDVAVEEVAREHRAFGAAFDRPAPPRRAAHPSGRRIRVGYVSADFMKHPVGLFLRPVLAHHDRAAFETFCYSNGTQQDALTEELRASAMHWRGLRGRGDDWAAQRIRDDGIDVLVDLSGHTAHNRLGVFALAPAPVQATWLGYLNSSGLAAMDYRICDAGTDPPGASEALYSEALARLPHSQWCYQPYHAMALDADPRAGAAGPAVFGSFNQFAKVSDACLDLWCAVLRAAPGTRLQVYAAPEGVAEAFAGRIARRGVAPERVTLHGRLGILEYFSAIANVDIALDPLPYNGATTTLDTLWMGVPVVALAGDRPISRGSFSIAAAAGLEELLAATSDAYVERNVALAQDARARTALRRGLRSRLEASPLMDAAGFTRDLETAYRRMLGMA
jgi:protein O-GlcNAc transferase